MEGLYGLEFRRSVRGNQWARHRARRAEADPGASRRAFSRAMGHVHLRGGAAVRSWRPSRRCGQHHVLPRAISAAPRISSRWRSPWKPRAGSSVDLPRRFRNAWIATVPGEGGSGLLAYDDDRRIVGACRSARSMLALTDGLIESGIDCPMSSGSTIRPQAWRTSRVELHRADGSALGQGHVAPPLRAKPARSTSAPRSSCRPV